MITGLVDHMWQSCCCSLAACAFSWLLRADAAVFRLWLWRIAALKFLLPFSLLFALGAWLGFPSPHVADPAPPGLVRSIEILAPFTSPARTFGWSGLPLVLAAVAALGGVATFVYWIRWRLGVERLRVQSGMIRREVDGESRPGFLSAALMSAWVTCAISVPMLAGAVHDRQQRREWLIANSIALRDASIDMKPAARGLGDRLRVEADARGVSIRNASIHDLVAIAYGVNRYSVISPQMMHQGDTASRSWIHWPRYDVRVDAAVPELRDFEPYALRQGLTRMLSEKFGLEIYVNGDCQPPCGHYHLALADEPL